VTDRKRLLASTATILLIDWPSRDVPDTLARHGFTVISHDDDAPDAFNSYKVMGDDVRVEHVGRLPENAGIVYTHRPIDELAGIVETAKSVGAKAVWIQSGRDSTGAKDPRGVWFAAQDSSRARGIVEGAGLEYVEAPYIGDAVRALD
jgi:uncharacterized UPF0146 family protein